VTSSGGMRVGEEDTLTNCLRPGCDWMAKFSFGNRVREQLNHLSGDVVSSSSVIALREGWITT